MYKRWVIRILCLCLLLVPASAGIVRRGLVFLSSLVPFPLAGVLLCFLVMRFRLKRLISAILVLLLIWLPLYGKTNVPDISGESLSELIDILTEKVEALEEVTPIDLSELSLICRRETGGCIKFSRFPEWMTKTRTAGVFIPLTGEAIVNPLEPTFTLPFVAMHEIAHQKGIMDEGKANFYAYCACINSSNASLCYSAYIYALKYAFLRLRTVAPELIDARRQTLSGRVQSDLGILGAWNESSVTRAFPFFAGDYGDIVNWLVSTGIS